MTLRTLGRGLFVLVALLCVGCRVRSDHFVEQGASKAAQGDYKAAIADFDEALKLTSRNEEAYFFRGQARDKLNNYDGAIDDFTKYIALTPFRWDGYLRRGLAKAAKDDFAGAIVDYTIAARKIEISEPFESHDDRSKSEWEVDIDEARRLASAHLRNFANAIDALNGVLTTDPDNLHALYERGSARIRSGDQYGGCRDWLSAKKRNYPVAEKALQQFGESKVRVDGGNGLPEPCQAAQ
jgi:tetratricopeptide (TPR) repeat protein